MQLNDTSIVNIFSEAKILCLGDVMLDTFISGEVERISPEAPVPVLRVTEVQNVLGGAGNVVRNLVGLGVQTSFLSVTGKDQAGAQIADLLRQVENITFHLHCDQSSRVTTQKTRYLSHQQLLRVDVEDALPLQWGGDLAGQIEEKIQAADHVILSDYEKGFFTPESCRRILDYCVAHGKPVIVDPKGRQWEKYKGAWLLTPNRKELIAYCGRSLGDKETLIEAAREVVDHLRLGALLVTLGAEGMVLVTADRSEPPIQAKAAAREVYDVSGAGDTVISVLTAALSRGACFRDAVHLANVAAGIVVGKIGTASIYREDLIQALQADETATKILSLPLLKDRVMKWRRRGKIVGFTNGCFDLLHPGHLSLLSEAKAQCDILIVGLNTDASIQRLKGESRPIQDQEARAQILAALAVVDGVILFGEDTPLDLIKAIKPDVLIKGADYTVDKVVGADLVLARGGRVHLATLREGRSTTRTVRRLRNEL